MGTITLTIPAEVKSELKTFSWVNWSELAIGEVMLTKDREKLLHELDTLLKGSEFTADDVLKISKKSRKGRFKELKTKGWV